MIKTLIEHLSVEIWLLILCYFELHDLFQGFTNLNTYFDQLLASHYLSFNVQLKKSDKNHIQYSSNSNFSDCILNRIVCLSPSVLFRCNYVSTFLINHLQQLIHLQSLTIRIRIREIPSICTALRELRLLRYLSIRCVPNQNILEAILVAPSLYVCQLEVWRPISSINDHFGTNSNVQTLYIIFLNEPNFLIMNLLLSHMPKLKKLEISECDCLINDSNALFNQKVFIFQQLLTFKMTWNYWHIISNFFQRLYRLMPVLKRFYLNAAYYKEVEILMINLIYHWWLTIEQMEKMNIFIQYKEPIKTKNNLIQMNSLNKLNTYREILLGKNDRLNGNFKIKWTEKSSDTFIVTNISIQKS